MKRIIGIVLIIIGLAGLVLPIMPGWIFIIPGLKLAFPSFTPLLLRYIKKNAKN